ncbi:hypothetical protein LXM60_03740 [Pandoraea sputorum]|uniref:hypothetical protein n=1 Tax=Pandoraea sputorum TaxID=93222 RepID=UPI001E2C4FF8|nr:hypothetical protein [Pandoraea sputorum]MCE4059319.1 hypothetical protein [Pandoraea sputorum]
MNSQASGFDQTALDEAAQAGFGNGAFEEAGDDVPAVVEEFYPEGDGESGSRAGGNSGDPLLPRA